MMIGWLVVFILFPFCSCVFVFELFCVNHLADLLGNKFLVFACAHLHIRVFPLLLYRCTTTMENHTQVKLVDALCYALDHNKPILVRSPTGPSKQALSGMFPSTLIPLFTQAQEKNYALEQKQQQRSQPLDFDQSAAGVDVRDIVAEVNESLGLLCGGIRTVVRCTSASADRCITVWTRLLFWIS